MAAGDETTMDGGNPAGRSVMTRLGHLWETRTADIATIAFLVSIASFLISTAFDLGVVGSLVGIAGTSACGFSWLLARAIFHADSGRELWPLIIVGALVAIGLPLDLLGSMRDGSGPLATGLDMAANIHALLSSTVLLLAFIEPWRDYRSDLPRLEKRFRRAFALAYGSLLIVSVVWLRSTPEGSWANHADELIRMISAGIAAALSLWAWRFRKRHPHPKRKRLPRRPAIISDEQAALGQRILRQIEEERVFLVPDLKLTDLAERMNVPDHKVRNAITGALGYPNFNMMINHFRINAAKDALRDGNKRDISILAIAFDCGFSSIGPFNRAFKLETGCTPTDFRKEFVASQTKTNG